MLCVVYFDQPFGAAPSIVGQQQSNVPQNARTSFKFNEFYWDFIKISVKWKNL